MPRRLPCLVILAACACSALASHTASATEFCVQTPSQLSGALMLAAAAEQPDDDVTIKLVRGVYNVPGQGDGKLYVRSVNRLRLLGGYAAGCGSRIVLANNTIINGQGPLDLQISSTGDALLVEGIRFQNLVHAYFGSAYECSERGETIIVRRSVFDFTSSPATPINSFGLTADCHDLRLENSLVIGGTGSGITSWTEDRVPLIVAVNNTFVNSTGDGLAIGRFSLFNATPVFHLYNNIFWNNAGLGLARFAGQAMSVFAYHNTWDGTDVPLTVGVGTSTGNPQLTSSFRPNEAGSPAINSGSNAVLGGAPSTDLDGGPRITGSTIDRGAYESAVDDAFTLTVTNANDSGAGSLRQAIISANATAGVNRIVFDIPAASGQCVLLQPASSYPPITDSLVVDGWTQPGSSPNTLDDGDNATVCVRIVHLGSAQIQGLRVPSGAPASTRLIVQGIGFGGLFSAVWLEGGANHIVAGNHFGAGLTAFFPGNIYGVRVDAPGVTVGGFDPSSRNVFAGNSFAAIELRNAGSTVRNNYIGTTRDGLSTSSGLANNFGIQMQSGASAALVTDNVISGNDIGVRLFASVAPGNTIGANRIGLPAPSLCGVPPLPACNTSMGNRVGIHSDGVSDLRVSGNAIARNLEQGVLLTSAIGSSAPRNRITGNTFHANGALGLDLVSAPDVPGVNPNGDGQPGAGVNEGQNYPVIAFAGGGRRKGSIGGTLISADDTYRIEMFSSVACNASGHGEGQTFHGHANVQSVGGSAAFALRIGETGGSALAGRAITLTATDSEGNTSEFSACAAYACDQIFAHGFDGSVGDTCPP